MGALLWVVKMLLKVMKPFVKLALLEALVGALESDGETTEETEETDTQSSENI